MQEQMDLIKYCKKENHKNRGGRACTQRCCLQSVSSARKAPVYITLGFIRRKQQWGINK
jgi:hypothetical protein